MAGTALPENVTHSFLRFVLKNAETIHGLFEKSKARIILLKTVRTYCETPHLL